MPNVMILNEQKLVYVLTPKVAATSLIGAMYSLAGLDVGDKNPRKIAKKKWFRQQAQAAGVEMRLWPVEQLVDLRRRHHDYFWFCARRNPFDRIVSAYHSKVHRYAWQANRKAFYLGSLRRFSEGPKAIDNSRYLARHVAKYISFEDMLVGLERTGLDFDAHFRLQSKNLGLDLIGYDMLLAQEDLAPEFQQMCQAAGLNTGAARGLLKWNASNLASTKKVVLGARTRGQILRLYLEDFQKLGYATEG